MPTILQKPGSIVPVHLASQATKPEADRMVVWIKVPLYAEYLEVDRISKDEPNNTEACRKIIGLLVDHIDNLVTDDGAPFKLDREKSGYLTKECCEILGPYANEITALCLASGRLTPVDAKNC